MRLIITFAIIAIVAIKTHYVKGHGYLAEPGARNSLWRLGFDTHVNYNDMELNCGGFSVRTN